MKTAVVNKVQSFAGHRDCVYALQPSAISSIFFSGSGDGMVVRWDMQSPDQGELIAKLPNSVYALHYHPKSNVLIAGHNYDGIHLLEWETKKEVGSLHFTEAAVFDIQSVGSKLYVATGDGVLTSIDSERISILNKTEAASKSARTIAIHSKRGEVAVGYSDHFIRVFDIDTLQLKYEWQAHTNSVFALHYSPDGNFLFSGSRDARLKVWDVMAGYTQAAEIVAHMYAINHIEFSPDGKHFVTCSMDKSIKVWDLEELRLLKVVDKARHAGHGTSVNKHLWTSNRSLLLSAIYYRSISSWDINFVFPGS
jgi:WD40 repeat protein